MNICGYIDAAKLYRAFAGVLLWPPDSEIAEYFYEITDGLIKWTPQDAERAGTDFSALFDGMERAAPPLWESAYLSRDKLLCGSLTLEVKRAYRDAGMCVREDMRQPADHIGIECEFFAELCCACDFTRAEKFLKKHLRPFAGVFAPELEKRAESPFYRKLAGLLNEITRSIEPGAWNTEFLRAKEDIRPKTPPTLRVLTDSELRCAPQEELIPSCGINNCGGRCPVILRVEDGCVLSVLPGEKGNDAEPRPQACVRGLSYRHTFMSPDRLRYPAKRVGKRGEGHFTRISWEEAIDTIADECTRIKRQYGPQSRYINYSSGINAVLRGDLFLRNLLALDGGYLGYYNSYSSACARIAAPYTFGTGTAGNSSSDLLNSKLIILWGHNPLETRFGSLTPEYLKMAKAQGTEIIVVDPRCSDTARELAGTWIGIKPTTDCALMAAMAYVILSEGLYDKEFMDSFCLGFDGAHMPRGYEDRESFEDYILGRRDGIAKTPEWASRITGASQGEIVLLARKYACIKPAALLQGLGPQRNGNGEQVIRFGAALASLTGNIGIKGGNAGCRGITRLHNTPEIPLEENPVKAKIPSFLWTDAVLRGHEMTAERDGVVGAERLDSDIKMIFSLAGNTLINQHSDIPRSAEILEDESLCEFIVCSDLFMTPSARFADILLPGVSMFESDNIGTPWEDGNYLLRCRKIMEPLFEARFEYGWLCGVAERLGHWERFSGGGKSVGELLENAYNELRAVEPELPGYDEFTLRGGWFYSYDPEPVAFAAQRGDFEKNPFPTQSGKIDIFSPELFQMGNFEEIPAIPKYVPSFEGPEDPLSGKYPLSLVGWHTKRRCHSLHDNNPRMEALEPPAVWIHPDDALFRRISDGETVEVFNGRGTVRLPAKVTERIIRGVCAMAQGAWYTPDRSGVDIRGSINVLTTPRPTPLAKGNPQHSCLVEIRKCAVGPKGEE